MIFLDKRIMFTTIVTVEIYYQYNNHGDVIRVSDRTGTLLNEYVTMSKGRCSHLIILLMFILSDLIM